MRISKLAVIVVATLLFSTASCKDVRGTVQSTVNIDTTSSQPPAAPQETQPLLTNSDVLQVAETRTPLSRDQLPVARTNDSSPADGAGNRIGNLRQAIPGEPGVNYPIFSQPPQSSFNCTGRHDGYYADLDARCQVFRVCANTDLTGQGFAFLCPNGTLFNQKFFVCDWYNNVDCSISEQFYDRNENKNLMDHDDMMEHVKQMQDFPLTKPFNKETAKSTPSTTTTTTTSPSAIPSRGSTLPRGGPNPTITTPYTIGTRPTAGPSQTAGPGITVTLPIRTPIPSRSPNPFDVDDFQRTKTPQPPRPTYPGNVPLAPITGYTPKPSLPPTSTLITTVAPTRRPTTTQGLPAPITVSLQQEEPEQNNRGGELTDKPSPLGPKERPVVYVSSLGELSTDANSGFDINKSRFLVVDSAERREVEAAKAAAAAATTAEANKQLGELLEEQVAFLSQSINNNGLTRPVQVNGKVGGTKFLPRLIPSNVIVPLPKGFQRSVPSTVVEAAAINAILPPTYTAGERTVTGQFPSAAFSFPAGQQLLLPAPSSPVPFTVTPVQLKISELLGESVSAIGVNHPETESLLSKYGGPEATVSAVVNNDLREGGDKEEKQVFTYPQTTAAALVAEQAAKKEPINYFDMAQPTQFLLPAVARTTETAADDANPSESGDDQQGAGSSPSQVVYGAEAGGSSYTYNGQREEGTHFVRTVEGRELPEESYANTYGQFNGGAVQNTNTQSAVGLAKPQEDKLFFKIVPAVGYSLDDPEEMRSFDNHQQQQQQQNVQGFANPNGFNNNNNQNLGQISSNQNPEYQRVSYPPGEATPSTYGSIQQPQSNLQGKDVIMTRAYEVDASPSIFMGYSSYSAPLNSIGQLDSDNLRFGEDLYNSFGVGIRRLEGN